MTICLATSLFPHIRDGELIKRSLLDLVVYLGNEEAISHHRRVNDRVFIRVGGVPGANKVANYNGYGHSLQKLVVVSHFGTCRAAELRKLSIRSSPHRKRACLWLDNNMENEPCEELTIAQQI